MMLACAYGMLRQSVAPYSWDQSPQTNGMVADLPLDKERSK